VGLIGTAEDGSHAAWRMVGGFVLRRAVLGVLTLVLVSILVFGATEVLPGNAAYAVLGHSATPQSLHALERQLHLTESVPAQYLHWITGVLSGHPGVSLADGQPAGAAVSTHLVNSAVLVLLASVIGTLVGVGAGIRAAARRDGWLDHVSTVFALVLTALPEFLIGLMLVILFATSVFHVLPAVSLVPPGTRPWSSPNILILPVATLVLVIVPYTFRMTRGAMVEALESDYVEMARLKGMSNRRVLYAHALPNTVPVIVQVTGLNLLYLAGGIVLVEYIFNYPGVGQELVAAISNRDIPVVQLLVVSLAMFYVVVNICADVIALLATPRRRLPRSG
jgi:peptide/nickel transport system permease protein